MLGPNLILLSRSKAVRDALNAKFSPLCGELTNLHIIPIELEEMSQQKSESIQGVVLDIDQWTPADEPLIIKMRDHGYVGGVLVLGNRAPGINFPHTRNFDKVVFVDKPYADKEVIGIVRRMLLAPIVAARRHPRHETDESAELQFEAKKNVEPCRVKNMSKGGAYLEFGKSMQVRIGDAVTLKIKLGQLNREYALKARVAWINPRGGFGIEFTNSF